MIKAPIIPIGYQHTMCVIGVSLARASMEVLGPGLAYKNKANAQMVQRIQRWIEACSLHCKKYKLSQGAKRDMDAVFLRIGSAADAANDEEKRMDVWAAVLSAANIFIFDARTFAKDITKGESCWRWLDQTTYSLVRRLAKVCPDAESVGYQMYLELQVDFSQFRKKDAAGNVIYEREGGV